jgi:hypothetical protein
MRKTNFKNLILIIINTTLILFSFINTQLKTPTTQHRENATCDLKLAKEIQDLFKGNTIFDSGVVNKDWEENSTNLYHAMSFNTIDYFYLMEDKVVAHEDIIVILLYNF